MTPPADSSRRYIVIGMAAVLYVLALLVAFGMRDRAATSTLAPLPQRQRVARVRPAPLPTTQPVAPATASPTVPPPIAEPPDAPLTPPIAPPRAKPIASQPDEPMPARLPALPQGAEVAERKWQDLTFRFVRVRQGDDFQGRLEIYVGTRLVYSLDSYRFIFPDETEGRIPALGTDITGEGMPDFVFKEWTGGARCCFLYHIFQWRGSALEALATLEASHSEFSTFRDVDGDGAWEFITNDWTFAEWKTDLAQTPAPAIILYYAKPDERTKTVGGYRLALHLMARPAPTAHQQAAVVQQLQDPAQWRDGTPPMLWTEALKLIYTGHLDQAMQFLRQAWPLERDGRDAFIAEFVAQLRRSPHWPVLQQWQPPVPPLAAPTPASPPTAAPAGTNTSNMQ